MCVVAILIPSEWYTSSCSLLTCCACLHVSEQLPRSPVQRKEQLDDFILGMTSHSDALSADLAAANATMSSMLAAVHSNSLELLRFFREHEYTPPQAVSAALNKAAGHVSMHESAGVEAEISGNFSFASSNSHGRGVSLQHVLHHVVLDSFTGIECTER